MKSYSFYQPPPPGYIAEQHPRMMEAIVAHGHEVGLHGYLHEKLITLTQEQEEEILARCIEILTHITGQRPVGYRAPWFELNPWTPDLSQKYQIQYCASMMGDDVPYTHPDARHEIDFDREEVAGKQRQTVSLIP